MTKQDEENFEKLSNEKKIMRVILLVLLEISKSEKVRKGRILPSRVPRRIRLISSSGYF